MIHGSQQATRVAEQFAKNEKLPSIPTVAAEVVRLTRDENTSLDDLAHALALDPALTARLLKMANSPLFSMGGPITTLQRATMVLGMKTVKLLALSFSLVGAFQKQGLAGFDYGEFWRRSLVSAVAGRGLAATTGSQLGDEAFLAGLLSRIGQLILTRCMSDEYGRILARSSGLATHKLERETLGFDSAELGALFLQSWQLPEVICLGIWGARSPGRLPPEAPASARELVGLMEMATRCEDLVCGEPKAATMNQLYRFGESRYDLSRQTIDEFVMGLETSVAETALLLDVDVPPLHVAEILEDAQRQLLEEALGATSEAELAKRQALRLATENQKLSSLARKDTLTGLANRATFEDRLRHCVESHRAGRTVRSMGLLVIDVDHFKRVNDSYGHQAGDSVLETMGKLLLASVRETDLAARYGGEEFAVITASTTASGLSELARRIRCMIEQQRLEVGGQPISITVSIGGALADRFDSPTAARDLVERADRLMYEAKRRGRNNCVIEGLSGDERT